MNKHHSFRYDDDNDDDADVSADGDIKYNSKNDNGCICNDDVTSKTTLIIKIPQNWLIIDSDTYRSDRMQTGLFNILLTLLSLTTQYKY